jgi:hypothetical protein
MRTIKKLRYFVQLQENKKTHGPALYILHRSIFWVILQILKQGSDSVKYFSLKMGSTEENV